MFVSCEVENNPCLDHYRMDSAENPFYPPKSGLHGSPLPDLPCAVPVLWASPLAAAAQLLPSEGSFLRQEDKSHLCDSSTFSRL